MSSKYVCTLQEKDAPRGPKDEIAIICAKEGKYWIDSCGNVYPPGTVFTVVEEEKNRDFLDNQEPIIGYFPEDQETIRRIMEEAVRVNMTLRDEDGTLSARVNVSK